MTEPAPRIVVTVGTDHHPFTRLVGWVDAWAAAHPDIPVLIQRGETAAPAHARSVPMIGYDDLVAAMAGADLVIAQGGPGGIMDARSVGRCPVVVPRRGSLGEHVDDHQVRFCAWMAERELVHLAESEADLHACCDRAIAEPGAFAIPPDTGAVEATVARFAELMAPLLARGRGRRGR